MSELLRVTRLSASYRQTAVIREISFSLQAGEIAVLCGPNGSGKSTLLKALAGSLTTGGNVCLNGRELLTRPASKRSASLAFLSTEEESGLEIRCRDAVAMALYPDLGLLRRPDPAQEARITALFDRFEIRELAQESFRELSAGQKQLIRLLRCLIRPVPLLLLDEPDRGLDLSHRRILTQVLRERVREEQRGILISSHDINAALQTADRLLLLKDGRLLSDLDLPACSESSLAQALSACLGPVTVYRRPDGYRME